MVKDSLFMREVGPTSARAVVFLHGGGVGGWMWDEVISRLPEYRCLAPDLPETGRSARVAPFSMPYAAQKVAELIRERVPGGRASVVGLSEGAQVLVQLLASVPEIIDRAVVSSALLRPIPGAGWAGSPAILAWSYRMSIPPFRNNDWWIRMNMKYAAGIPERFFAQFKQSFQETTESGFVNVMAANQHFRLPAGLGKASVPTLVVVGSKEYGAMKQSARDLVATLPQAKAVQVNLGPKASLAEEHNWALTDPECFARTVRAWLEDSPLPDGLTPLT